MFIHEDIMVALHNGDFFLEYLPTMSLVENRCSGAEALIRWRKGTQIIPPLEFIPAIENTPLSGLVTYWVIETIAKELRTWLFEQKNIHISINIPPELFGRGGLQYALQKSGLTDVTDKLMIEVTERGLLDTLGIAGLDAASKNKLVVALDDLSANDAKLFVLSRVPADIVKLDKSFADEMLRPDWSKEKIAGLSALIGSGNLQVIAEGIETAEQLAILLDAGVQTAQGWYFSRSLPAAAFIDYYSVHQ